VGDAGSGQSPRAASRGSAWVVHSRRCQRVHRPEAGSYLRLIDSCITQLKAQGPFRICNESREEEEKRQTSLCAGWPGRAGWRCVLRRVENAAPPVFASGEERSSATRALTRAIAVRRHQCARRFPRPPPGIGCAERSAAPEAGRQFEGAGRPFFLWRTGACLEPRASLWVCGGWSLTCRQTFGRTLWRKLE